MKDERPTVDRRLCWVAASAVLALLATLVAEGEGSSFPGDRAADVVQLMLLAVLLAIVAYDFVRSGRRR